MDEPLDLGALAASLTQRLIAAETPLLALEDLTMWQYVVLSELGRRAAPSQLVLSQRIGYDKTRLIDLIDALAARGLISRERDPADRRAQMIALTPSGRGRLQAARARIHVMESELLAGFTDAERTQLRSLLTRLHSQ